MNQDDTINAQSLLVWSLIIFFWGGAGGGKAEVLHELTEVRGLHRSSRAFENIDHLSK